MPKRSDERTEYLRDILECGLDGANYWARIIEYHTTPFSVASILDTETDERHLVTIDTMAKGIAILTNDGKAHSMGGREYWQQFLLSNRTNGEDGDYDADIADNILQAGIFGEVLYG